MDRFPYSVSVAPTCPGPFLGPTLAQACVLPQFFIFMSLIDTFIRSKNEISQLCERVTPVNPAEYYYDFIVVGGGTAGAVVASRLSEVPEWKVLLLEAGPDEPPGAEVPSMVAMFLGSDIDWSYTTMNEKNACLSNKGSCSWPRGKNLGGTSVHNGMMYVRGHARDYDNWAAMGNRGWSWQEVLPFFMCSENNTEIDRLSRGYHGVGGPLTVERFPWRPAMTDDILAAAMEKNLGLTDDLNGPKITGFTVAQTNSKDGVRVSSASAFLRPYRDRKNLHVVLNATVTKIVIQDLKAIGVDYVKNNEVRSARATREVIVSGGAVDSPKLLLLSGIGPSNHLNAVRVPVKKHLPGVGENLHNHVSYALTYEIDEPNENDLTWAAAVEYVAFQKGPMSSTGLSQVTGVVASKFTTPDHPDLQFYFGGYQASCAATGEVGALMNTTSPQRRKISSSPTNLHPLSRGNLRLASNNPMDKPIIWGNYLQHPRDAAVLIEGIKIAHSLMNSRSMRKYKPKLTSEPVPACSAAFPYLSDAYWNCSIRQETGPENHQAGSCKMGPASDPMAVVDSQLKVHGIRGLRVADTSIMPVVTSGNTAAPAMMIGERAAAFIKQEWGSAPAHCCGSEIKNNLEQILWNIKYNKRDSDDESYGWSTESESDEWESSYEM